MNINKINNISLLTILIIFLSGCTSVVEHETYLFEGENLITPYSGFLAGWRLSVKNEDNYHSSMWQHPIQGFKDAYVISVTLPEPKKIAYFRQVIDKPGYDSCSAFTTLTLQSSVNNRYPSEIWQTHCKKQDGREAKILHMLLQGQDSFYHIQKIWQDSFIAQEIVDWQNRFKQIYLCDNRAKTFTCPSNESL